MTKKVNKNKKLPYVFLTAIAFCFTLMLGILMSATPVYAYSKNASSSNMNLNFAYNSNTTSIYSNPTGWTKGLNNDNTTCGVINLKEVSNETCKLESNQKPEKLLGSTDDHILMINSKTESSSLPAVQYYTNSSNLTLNAYSNYKIKIYTQVNYGARASIYVTGLNEDLYFENISNEDASTWTAYTFFISTGMEAQNIKLELWLGSKPNYTSGGAVFFDDIEFLQVSENEINESNSKIKYLNLNKSTLMPNFNASFEPTNDVSSIYYSNPLADWSRINTMSTNSYAEILNLSNDHESVAKGISYVGTDLSRNSSHAFVLYTTDDTKTYLGYKSKDINLNMYDIVKVSINVKTADLNGSAYIIINENEVKDFNNKVVEAITPNKETITISSNTTNDFTNDYTTCTFFLRGRSLYNTSYNLELWLGSEENPSSGLVAFDNLTIENISYNDYSNASTSTSVVKMNFETDPDKYIIKNSAFNVVEKSDKTLTYPLIPSNWTHTEKDSNDSYFGVINTNKSIYDTYKNEFGNIANPGNPEGFGSTSTDTNNVLLMSNINDSYQSIKSSNFSVDSNSYYKLTFAYNIFGNTQNIFNVLVQDDDGNTLYTDENISHTNNNWKTYTLYINTKAYTNTLNLILGLGTEQNLVSGVVFIDNVILVKDSNMTADDYKELAKSNNVLDFEQGNFNLVKPNSDGTYTPLRYTSKLENNAETSSGLSAGYGAIIDAENNEFGIEKSENSDSALKYIMMIQTMDKATYSMTAKDSLSLTANTYHKFTIDIKTQGLTANLNKSDKYGAIFALYGLDDKLEGIIAEDWTTYTIYVASTSTVSVNVKFALASLDRETCGNAFFDNFTYEVIDQDAYNLAQLANKSNTLFIGNTDTTEDDNTNDTSANMEYIWYVIPTLILAIALILALVAFLMKKVKIKKWEKRKINEYDREKTVHRDVIRAEAEKRRDASVNELKSEISKLENEKQHIEEIHQEQLKNSRLSRAEGISRATEREFKQYAKMHTAIENRIASINKQINNMNTAEYLLSVQHKIILEKAKADRLAKEKAYAKEKNKKSTKKTK